MNASADPANGSPSVQAPSMAKSRRKRVKRSLVTAVASPLLSWLLRILQSTWRVEFDGLERWPREKPVLFTFWHGRMVVMALASRLVGARACILISQHDDGEIATRMMQAQGIEVVRGSASRGGAGGVRGLVRAYRRGVSPVVVPDGPRGPRCKAKPGFLHLARMTGADIVPLSFSTTSAWQLSTWDCMVVPKPFARICIAVGDVCRVSAKADEAEIEDCRLAVESALDATTRRAQEVCGAGL